MDQTIEITAGSVTIFIPRSELTFRTSRSGGPGGQNVNKLETRVELEFDVMRSESLSEKHRQVLMEKLKNRMSARGILRIAAQDSRSQWSNREEAVKRFVRLLEKALKPAKKRVPTRPSRSAQERRLLTKKRRSEKKRMRRVLGD